MDQIADFATIGQDAGNRCYQSIHASQRSSSTSKRRDRTRMAGDEGAALEEAEEVSAAEAAGPAATFDFPRNSIVAERQAFLIGKRSPKWARSFHHGIEHASSNG